VGGAVRILILTLLITSCAFAGGSIFGTQATGDRIVAGGVRAVGLGGAGLAIWDSLGFHSENPAAAAYTTGATLRVGFFGGHYGTSDKNASDSDSEFGWQAFRLYLNVHPRYKMGIGIDPVSRTDVRTFGQDSLGFETDSGMVYQNFESRRAWLGSSTDIRWDHAVKFSDKFALGATIAFASNYLEVGHNIDFPSSGSSSGPRDVYYRDIQRFSGFWGGLSFLARPSEKLSVGGFWKSETDGDWDYERAVNHGGEFQFTETGGTRPGEIGLGVGYHWARNWAAYLDMKQQSWTKKQYGPMFENSSLEDRDALSAMLGVEKLGGTRLTDEGFDRWDYRAGFAFRQQPWQVISGATTSDVTEMALSLGVTMPLVEQSGKLHLALEFGQRAASDVDVTENFGRFYLQLDMHERWFKRERRKLRD